MLIFHAFKGTGVRCSRPTTWMMLVRSPIDPALAFRFRSLHEAGGQLVFSSDWPVVEVDPLHAMLEAVRPDRSESVDVMTALEAVTSAAARMVRLPDRPFALEGQPLCGLG